MITTLLGSCRLRSFTKLLDCTSINEDISYVHSTKEIIQLIKFIKGEISLFGDILRYAFRTGILEKKQIQITQNHINQLNNTDLFIVEISSIKKYIYENVYLHHLTIDHKFSCREDTSSKFLSGTIIKEQNKEEIKNDIDELLKLFENKKVIFVSHILPNNKKLEKRKYLIDTLTNICNSKKLDLINPTEVMFDGLLMDDLGHYKPEAETTVILPFYKKKLIEMKIIDC